VKLTVNDTYVVIVKSDYRPYGACGNLLSHVRIQSFLPSFSFAVLVLAKESLEESGALTGKGSTGVEAAT
jgi:hypothetical protein